jgi:hypothetical protein
VNSITGPIQSFTVSLWRVENGLKVLDPFRGTTEAKYSLDIGRWIMSALYQSSSDSRPTFLFQEDATFGNHDGDVAIDEAFALFIGQGYRDIGVSDALSQSYSKNSWCNSC